MGKRILLADDSVTIHKVVELTFLDEDYSVEAVSNGDEAIAKLAGEAPDLVIADVHMPPGPSGYEVCEKVREMHPGVPVLLLAGAFEAFDEERAKAADAYLKKPFDSQRLLQTVQELMAAGEGAAAPDSPAAAPEADATETDSYGTDRSGGGMAGGSEAGASEGDAGDAGPVEEAVEAAPEPAGVAPAAAGAEGEHEAASTAPVASESLSSADIDAIARRVVELLGDDVVREVAWEVVPDLAEVVVKDRLRELEEPVD